MIPEPDYDYTDEAFPAKNAFIHVLGHRASCMCLAQSFKEICFNFAASVNRAEIRHT